MINERFIKLSNKEKSEIYGGWAWLVAAIPLAIQLLMSTVSSFKMLQSDNGSVKFSGIDSHWSSSESKSKKTRGENTEAKTIVYAY